MSQTPTPTQLTLHISRGGTHHELAAASAVQGPGQRGDIVGVNQMLDGLLLLQKACKLFHGLGGRL